MSNLRLGVEVVSARNLVPKDGQGSCSAFVELHFAGQKFHTTTKEKDVNPVWNESFYFNIPDPNLVLDAYVYNHINPSESKSFLGKVRLTGKSFVPFSNAVALSYPLDKRVIFRRMKKQLYLKVFKTDDPSIESSNEQQHHSTAASAQQTVKYGADDMKSESQAPKLIRTHSGPSSQQPVDYGLHEISPVLGGGQIAGGRVIPAEKPASTQNVEQMQFLFVRVVKARDLRSIDVMGSPNPYVKVRVGKYRRVTKHYEKNRNPEWNEVFAFARDRMQSSVLDVVVKDRDLEKDDFVGIVRFDLNKVPMISPDSPLAPKWYKLEDKKEERVKGELMLAVWNGTQADEAFLDTWHSNAVTPIGSTPAAPTHILSKVYHSPRLWYLRVNIIEAQDLVVAEETRITNVHVKAQVGKQVLKTKTVQGHTLNPLWNEKLMFVTAEPFKDHIVLSVEDCVAPNKDEIIGVAHIPLKSVEKHADDQIVNAKWCNLEKSVEFSGRLHFSVCLERGYNVLDESTHYRSNLQPAEKQLWQPSIGNLELNILKAEGLLPMKARNGKNTSDTYCVAKYGHIWFRTRTIISSLSPKYNEKYTWEVYDPATVLTIGVFDNSQVGEIGSTSNKDMKIGKVRIRISTLENDRLYSLSYPLVQLHPSSVKKMGELCLAIRFSCTSTVNMMFIYSQPLLPKMHYIRPLPKMQDETLRCQAVNIVASQLSNEAETPLGKEAIEYMLDVDSQLWSLRRSKENFLRLMSVFKGLVEGGRWLDEIFFWKNPVKTVCVHVLFALLVCFMELILTTVLLYISVMGILNYRHRPKVDTGRSHAEYFVHPDELDEEFDTFPTSQANDVVRMRYDRLRSIAGRMQTVVGDACGFPRRAYCGTVQISRPTCLGYMYDILSFGCHCVLCDSFQGHSSCGWVLFDETSNMSG